MGSGPPPIVEPEIECEQEAANAATRASAESTGVRLGGSTPGEDAGVGRPHRAGWPTR